jgi:hypothetical protein
MINAWLIKISMRRNLSLHLKLPGQDYAAEGSTMYKLMPENQRYKHTAFQHEANFTTMSAYYSCGHSNTSCMKSTMLSSITTITNS